MRKIRVKVEGDGEVDPSVVRQLVRVTDTFQKLVRTDILHDQHQNPEKFSEDDLLKLAPEALKVLGGGDVEIE